MLISYVTFLAFWPAMLGRFDKSWTCASGERPPNRSSMPLNEKNRFILSAALMPDHNNTKHAVQFSIFLRRQSVIGVYNHMAGVSFIITYVWYVAAYYKYNIYIDLASLGIESRTPHFLFFFSRPYMRNDRSVPSTHSFSSLKYQHFAALHFPPFFSGSFS